MKNPPDARLWVGYKSSDKWATGLGQIRVGYAAHNCRTEESVWEKVNYCHNNPVRRGLVRQAADWKWSSFGYYATSNNVLLEIDVAATD